MNLKIEKRCGLTLLFLLAQLTLISCQNGDRTAGKEVVILNQAEDLEPISPYSAIGVLHRFADPLDVSTQRHLLVEIVDFDQKRVIIIDSTPPPFPYLSYVNSKEIAYITSNWQSINLVVKTLAVANTEDTLLSCRFNVNSSDECWLQNYRYLRVSSTKETVTYVDHDGVHVMRLLTDSTFEEIMVFPRGVAAEFTSNGQNILVMRRLYGEDHSSLGHSLIWFDIETMKIEALFSFNEMLLPVIGKHRNGPIFFLTNIGDGTSRNVWVFNPGRSEYIQLTHFRPPNRVDYFQVIDDSLICQVQTIDNNGKASYRYEVFGLDE